VNVRDKNGKTPLRKASRYGLAGIVEELLKKRHTAEELNAKDSVSGVERTTLHAAAYNGHFEVVSVLLGAGADSRLFDGEGKIALDLAHEGWLRGNRDSPESTILRLIDEDSPSAMEDAELLCSAAMKRSLPILRKLLQDPKADPNRKTSMAGLLCLLLDSIARRKLQSSCHSVEVRLARCRTSGRRQLNGWRFRQRETLSKASMMVC
jgi:Ankyrin repeats (3 copies)